MQNIKDISIARMPEVVESLGLRSYVANQIIQWLYKEGVTGFCDMTNISRAARDKLSQNYYIGSLKLIRRLESGDGTVKFAWELEDGNIIESVLIPSEPYSKVPPSKIPFTDHRTIAPSHHRTTLCISTQVGCAMRCVFCRTAGMGFVRNLTQGEILEQILAAIRVNPPTPPLRLRSGHALSKGGKGGFGRITNVVLMGMGEPLNNYDNVVGAVRIMVESNAFGLSKRHVTVSTSGIIPGIEKLAKENLGIKLAISLNATTDDVRDKLMPVNKKYPIKRLMEACRRYVDATGRYRLTFEYVMLHDLNDLAEDAQRLVKMLSHISSKVNLIPLNPPIPPLPKGGKGGFSSPPEADIQRFAQHLRNKHIQVNIRVSRGQDILAACGQLGGQLPSS